MTIRKHLALLLIASSATSACGQDLDVLSMPSGLSKPVSAQETPRKTIRVEEGQVTCIHKVQVAAQADGLIEQLLADEGVSVTKGDTLLMIDSRVAKVELDVAKKELEAAMKTAEQTANVDYAKAAARLSKEEYEDESALYQKGSSTYSAVKRKHLEAQRSFFGEDVAVVQHENEKLAAEVAREKVRAAEVQLELFKVVAPYDGVIAQRIRDQGEFIRTGEPVLRLNHMSEMMVEAFVPVDGIAVSALYGAPVKIQVRINPEQFANYDAKIDFVSSEISSRRVRVTAKIQNEKLPNAGWLLLDGMVASVEISLQ